MVALTRKLGDRLRAEVADECCPAGCTEGTQAWAFAARDHQDMAFRVAHVHGSAFLPSDGAKPKASLAKNSLAKSSLAPLSFETPDFAESFRDLLRWRRDMRHFRRDPVDGMIIDELLADAHLAPSVGYSQPWRFVLVEDEQRRDAVRRDFAACNAAAAENQDDDRAALYRTLKLEGLSEAPVHLAVCCDHATSRGHGLGRRTQPETLRDSVVCAVQILWLAARIRGLGVGWVSILNRIQIQSALDLPPDWELVAYLLIGWPTSPSQTPELARLGWETRVDPKTITTRR